MLIIIYLSYPLVYNCIGIIIKTEIVGNLRFVRKMTLFLYHRIFYQFCV